MPRAKVADYWVSKVHELAENEPGWGAAAIERGLEKVATAEGQLKELPSLRTIGRILRHHRHGLTPDERAAYKRFSWPAAMENGLLPWEASRIALDVLRWYLEAGRKRPTNQRVLWHWRLSLASPSLTVDRRDAFAAVLEAKVEDVGPRLEWDVVLAFEPWKSAEGAAQLRAAAPEWAAVDWLSSDLLQNALEQQSRERRNSK